MRISLLIREDSMHLPFQLKIKNLTLLSIFLLFSLGSAGADAQEKAPDFTLKDLSGNEVSLKDYRGQIVLLDFWATWCVPCRKSIPELVELRKKYKSKDWVIFGLAIDDPESWDDKYVADFAKNRMKINYTVLRAGKKVIRDYLGVEPVGIPFLVFIDRQGMIADKVIGHVPGAAERSLKRLLE
jgi:cytochrome c biogenesis protein CcmG/thiol:disulfide interchange protein DsbE